jgi:type VI secretion system secreted protein VgrG
MELVSQQNMTISSSEGHVVLQAWKSVTLTDGGGAYIKLENGNVTIASPAQVTIKMANFKWDGPDSIAGKFPGFSACSKSADAAAGAGENSVALT